MARWARIAGVVVAATVSLALVAVPSPAQAVSADEAKVHALVNQVRASAGAPALAFDESLAAISRTWAAKMAADGTISHNPALSTQAPAGWMKLSENVGQGPDIDTVHRALVASHSHYVNMTDTEVTVIGIGVVRSGANVFIVENFMGGARVGPKPTPAPTPTTPTTKAPAPAPPTTVPRPATTVAPKAPAPTTTTVPAPAPVPAGTRMIDVSPWGALAVDVLSGGQPTG